MSKKDIVDEIHHQARRYFPRRKVLTTGIRDLYQADLVDVSQFAKENNQNKFILTMINTFSKVGYAEPLKTKSANDVTEAMQRILKKTGHFFNLHTDLGKEFYNAKFKALMKKHHINLYSTFSIMKAMIVERFNRTLKGKMWKEFSLRGNYKWTDILQKLISSYNDTFHRTIQMKPNEVDKTNEMDIFNSVFRKASRKIPSRKPKFSVGDKVRISKYKSVFEKGYTPNFSGEIFEITKVQKTNPVTYLLKDYYGEEIKGGFYEFEILRVKNPDLYLVEKVLKRKKGQVLVKWLGFKETQWISEKDLL